MSGRILLHADMDAFFASVELSDHPEWRGKPIIVGAGPHERGVVSTCSYEARRFGVHSAMPSRTAYALCPHAIFVSPRMDRYQEVSDAVFEIFSRYSPFVEGVSVDEAFLDITGTVHLHTDPAAPRDPRAAARRLGEALRAEVARTCGVTCSVGIAPNRLLAKIGSEENKPNGLTLMPFEPDEIASFLESKPLRVLWGVGGKTLDALRPYGLTTCGDIQHLETAKLAALLGEHAAQMLSAYAFGRSDDTVHWQPGDEKSVSREHTFAADTADRNQVRDVLLRLVSEVGARFRRSPRWARTARLKLRDDRFNTVTRQIPFDRPARDDFAFREKALALFDREWPPHGRNLSVRLVGFGVTNLQDTPDADAPTLFETDEDAVRRRCERLSDTLDRLNARGLKVGLARR